MGRDSGKQIINWTSWERSSTQRYTCGYCGVETAPTVISKGQMLDANGRNAVDFAVAYACASCGCLSMIRIKDRAQFPGPLIGRNVPGVDEDVHRLYQEARQCLADGSYNAVAMLCRKIILNVAAAHEFTPPNWGAFQAAVKHILDQHLIPKTAEGAVNVIRDIGNDASHEINLIDAQKATLALRFTEMLLQNVFEVKHLAQDYQDSSSPPDTPADPQP